MCRCGTDRMFVLAYITLRAFTHAYSKQMFKQTNKQVRFPIVPFLNLTLVFPVANVDIFTKVWYQYAYSYLKAPFNKKGRVIVLLYRIHCWYPSVLPKQDVRPSLSHTNSQTSRSTLSDIMAAFFFHTSVNCISLPNIEHGLNLLLNIVISMLVDFLKQYQ